MKKIISVFTLCLLFGQLMAAGGEMVTTERGVDAASELPGPLQAGWQGQPVCERLHEDDQQRILNHEIQTWTRSIVMNVLDPYLPHTIRNLLKLMLDLAEKLSKS